VDVMGSAATAATVTVNGQAAYRKGDYFQTTLALDNAAGPVYAQVNVVGTKQGVGAGGEDAVASQTGNVYVPQSVETYTYDADGNLTADGRWAYTWDAENRLIVMTALPNVPGAAKRKLEFAYDYMSRRIQKKVSVWNGATASYQLQSTFKYVYDGWNPVAELDGNNALVRSYTWGMDISGSTQGAGGVGGLLLIKDGGQAYQAGYDGNGNVTSLVKAATGKLSASYDYDPFGNTLRLTGDYAAQNPFKFSTRYTDAETGMLYYGLRYYQPQTGRWLSRDPLGEEGGANMYGFVSNDPVSQIDPFGLYEEDVHYYLTYFLARQAGCFSPKEATWVAEGNQGADEHKAYAPAQGIWHHHSIRLDQIGARQRRRHEKFHALTKPENHPGNLAELLNEAKLSCNSGRQRKQQNLKQKLMAFGRYLHYAQDMFSHRDYPDPWLGHGVEGLRLRPHMPDKTFGTSEVALPKKIKDFLSLPLPWDKEETRQIDRFQRALEMVDDTWKKLKEYCFDNKGCGYKSSDANLYNSMDKIRNFLRSRGGPDDPSVNPDTRSINEAELDFKRRFLTDEHGTPIPARQR
ncbi:MAG: RHS repeat-associated core domain-containing protein, partial [Pyrinomonadaceae bacterium]